jgi:hypothetical protein
MKALEDRKPGVNFYRMREVPGTFKLEKIDLDENDEMFHYFPRCNLARLERLNALFSAAS